MKDIYSNLLHLFIVLAASLLLVGCAADGAEASEKSNQAIASVSKTNEALKAEKMAEEAAAAETKRLKDEERLEELKEAKKALEEEEARVAKLAREKEARHAKRRAAKEEKERLAAEARKLERDKAREAANTVKEPIVEAIPEVAAGKGKLGFAEPTFNFGKVDQGDRVNHEFKFYNTGTEAINVTNVSASCGCTRPSYPFLPIEPGESGVIGVTFDTKGKLGRQKPSLTVNTDGNPGEYKIFLEGFVDSGSEEN